LPPQTLITNNYGQKKLKEPSCIKPLLNSGQNIPPTNKKKGIVVIIIFTKIIMVLTASYNSINSKRAMDR
jgi:hypothetical protein